MAFQVISTEDAQELTREFRSITGAKRHVADALITRIGGICADDSLWAGRTQRTQRDRVMKGLALVQATLEYDGPSSIEYEGLKWRIEHDADAPTRQQVSATRKAASKGHRWLDSVRFAGNCAQCKVEVSAGSRGWYEAPKLYCEPCGHARQPQAVAA